MKRSKSHYVALHRKTIWEWPLKNCKGLIRKHFHRKIKGKKVWFNKICIKYSLLPNFRGRLRRTISNFWNKSPPDHHQNKEYIEKFSNLPNYETLLASTRRKDSSCHTLFSNSVAFDRLHSHKMQGLLTN